MSNKIFKQHPELKEAFVTVDGEAFYTRNMAENHARTLTSKEIKRVTNPSFSNVAPVDMDDPQNASLGLIQTGETEKGDPELKQIVAQVKNDGAVDLAVVPVNDADVTNTGNVVQPAKVNAPVIEPAKVEATKVEAPEEKLTAKQALQKDYEKQFGEVPADHFTKAELTKAMADKKVLVAELTTDKK